MQINKDPRGDNNPKTVALFVKTTMTTDAMILRLNKVPDTTINVTQTRHD